MKKYKYRVKKNQYRCGCCFNGAKKCELKMKHYKSALRNKERFDALENMRENGFEKETNAEIRDFYIRDFLREAYTVRENDIDCDLERFVKEEGLDLNFVNEKEKKVKLKTLFKNIA